MKSNEPMRIAQIIGKWVGGGVEAVVMNYYLHVDKSKVQFDFICDSDSTNIPYEKIEKLGGRVILVPPYQQMFKYHAELKKVLINGQYKIVHSHINTLSVFSLFAAYCAKVPTRIAHSHSTTNKKEKKKNAMKLILKPLSKIFATDYMCCSKLAGMWLFGKKKYDKGLVYLLNNAIDLDKFKYNDTLRKEMRMELKLKDEDIVIGHIGRFVEQKNHTFLIDIFNEIHELNENALLVLVGQGPLENAIKEKVSTLNLDNYVKFLGQRNDAFKLYQAFDVFVLPSLYEGLPVVGIEAQASDLLCLFSKCMTEETKILESTKMMSLEDDASLWANYILNELKKEKRCDRTSQLEAMGFSIKKEAKKIEEFYLNKISKN